MSLGSNIRNKRKSLKLSQEYVAEQLEVSRQAVSKWEMGKSEPSTNNLIKLAKLFSCNINELTSSDKNVTEQKLLNSKPNHIFSIAGIIVSFILFVVGMLYAEQIPLLVIVGILGLGGVWYFVSQMVMGAMKNRK